MFMLLKGKGYFRKSKSTEFVVISKHERYNVFFPKIIIWMKNILKKTISDLFFVESDQWSNVVWQ